MLCSRVTASRWLQLGAAKPSCLCAATNQGLPYVYHLSECVCPPFHPLLPPSLPPFHPRNPSREEVHDNQVVWPDQFRFTCKMFPNQATEMLDTCPLRVSVRQVCVCVRACVRVCVRACVRVCVLAYSVDCPHPSELAVVVPIVQVWYLCPVYAP